MSDQNLRNPRGRVRPQDGRGRGEGLPGGLRGGRNVNPCSEGGPGHSEGEGRNQGGRNDNAKR